nr:uncharacterized protein LOC105098233 isoform X2 [Camelus dromedarius]
MVCGLARRSHCRSPRREGDMDNQRRLMNAGDSQSSGDVISSNLTIESHEPPKGNKKKPCVSKIIAIIIFLVILIITLATVLAVEKHKSSMEHVSCLDGWIGYLGKYFYFSENTTTWAASQNFCAAHAANLAVFNTTEELNFLKRYSDHSQYWIGLRRKPGQTWQWIDGTIYSGWQDTCDQFRSHHLWMKRSHFDKSSNSEGDTFQQKHPSWLSQHRRYLQPLPGLQIYRGKTTLATPMEAGLFPSYLSSLEPKAHKSTTVWCLCFFSQENVLSKLESKTL